MGGYATLSGQGGRTGKDTENASASQPGHCCLVGEDRVKTGAQHKKTPSRSPNIRRGCVSTRAAWHYIHTARLRAGRRIHCSAPHCKGYCHTNHPIRKPWGFTPTTSLYIWRAGTLLSRDKLTLAGALEHDALRVAKRREGYDSGGDGRRSRPVRVFGRRLTA